MKLQDYLHYYLGCKMIRSSHWEPQNEPYVLNFENIKEAVEFSDRPLLRRLEDMTEEEAKFILDNYSFCSVDMPMNKKKFAIEIAKRLVNQMPVAHYLLRQYFDLFGLIPAGLAIDIKTTTP